jgi:DNA-binding IclR family transcriptional regulator
MQSIERTFAILRTLAHGQERAGISEIARRADLPKSTTSRILASLEALGMVERLGDRYGLGSSLAALTTAAAPVGSLREVARPELAELAEFLGENASLVVDDGDEVLYIDTAMPPEVAVQVQDWTGERLPYHAAAGGLALMSGWSQTRRDQLVGDGLTAFTALTVASADALAAKMDELATTGVVWTMQEFAEDVNGLGAPIVGPNGDLVGAINVYGPTYRFPGEISQSEMILALREACDRITTRLTD